MLDPRAAFGGLDRAWLLVCTMLVACTAAGTADESPDSAPRVEDSAPGPEGPSDSSSLLDGPSDGGAEDAARVPPVRGAAVPWDEYEAEDGVTNGELVGPTRTFGELASEASGRRAVRLSKTGDYVRFVASHPASSIVVRYAIPDSPSGSGLDATISVYVDGAFRSSLQLTSRYAWTYGGEANSSSNDPKLGGAHHFFDEARALLPTLPKGAIVELRKDSKDTAAWYAIDLVDLEDVSPPLARPDGSLSITDYGAIAGDGLDDGPAIQKTVAAARSAGKTVWIPPGTFHSTTAAIDVASVTIRGAGMWHSTVRMFFARFRCTGDACRFHDFSILGETIARDDASPESGFLGGAGTGSRLENVWVEHTKTGWWVGPGKTDGLVIRGCRFRNLFADAVNLCNGASHSIVEQSHARNTGDDAFASWSPAAEGGENVGNVFRFDTVQVPWRANCFALYGGRDNRIEDSVCSDVVEYPGVLIAQQYKSHPFAGTTLVQRMTLTRAGGSMYGQEHGALKLLGFDGPMSGVSVVDVELVDPTFSGIHLQGPGRMDGVRFSNVRVTGARTSGVRIDANAQGGATFEKVVVGGGKGLSNDAPAFSIVRGSGNEGW